MPSLTDLYVGAGLPKSTLKLEGTNAARVSSTSSTVRRRILLTAALREGRITKNQLGHSDQQILTGGISANPHLSKGGHGVLGFLGNLGKDVASLRYVPQGLYGIGKAAVHDVAKHPESLILGAGIGAPVVAALEDTKHSQLIKNVVNPQLDYFKNTYGPGGGSFFKNLYEHPLGPIMDAATVLSGGLGAAAKVGAVAGRTAEEGSLLARAGHAAARMTSPEDRAPLIADVTRDAHDLEGNVIANQIPREYTERPLSKLGQIGLDKLAMRGDGDNWLYRRQVKTEKNRLNRVEHTNATQQALMASGQAIKQVSDIAHLSNDEAEALFLQHQGINTPELLDRLEAHRAGVLNDPIKLGELKHTGMSDYVAHKAVISPRVREIILNPSEEELAKMQAADKVWSDYVEQHKDGIVTDEQHAAHLTANQHRLLQDVPDAERETMIHEANQNAHIKPQYSPAEEAQNFFKFDPALGRFMTQGMRDKFGVGEFKKGPFEVDADYKQRDVNPHEMFADPHAPYSMHSTGETFLSGAARTDARLYLDHIRKREKDMYEKGLNSEWARTRAAKDAEGKTLSFANDREVKQRLGPKYTIVHPDLPMAFARAENDLIKNVLSAVEDVRKAHPHDPELNNLDMDAMLKRFADADAKAFVETHWAAFKKPGIAIPVDDFNYLTDLVRSNHPFNNAFGRMIARVQGYWASSTLAFMPRWALNTAAGSFITNMVEGVINPLDYMAGIRLRHNMPPGVRLGHTFEQEMLDRALPGYGKRSKGFAGEINQFLATLGLRKGPQELAGYVQNIENFFRQAAYVKQLRTRGKRVGFNDGMGMDPAHFDELTQTVKGQSRLRALTGIMDTVSGFMMHTMMSEKTKGNILKAMEDPASQRRALHEVNKFGYNYSVLGPNERRYVRTMVPFWGWYKFISQLTYKLPVEYPGRSNMLLSLSKIAGDDESQLGAMPDWVKGGLPFGMKDGKYSFLGTLGLNPFGQVFNPLAPGHSLTGIGQVGQLSPGIQALMAAVGYDPLTGGAVRVSPQEGVVTNRYGDLIDAKTGEKVSTAQVAPIRRGLMGLIRSVPQFRILERALDGPVYPESVPGIAERKMPTNIDSGNPWSEALQGLVGINPRTYDLTKYQQQVAQDKVAAQAKLRKYKLTQ